MVFKDLRVNIVTRVFGLASTLFVWTWLIQKDGYLVTTLLVGGLAVFQISGLVAQLEQTVRMVTQFLGSVRYGDFNQLAATEGQTGPTAELHQAFNKVLKDFKQLREEREADYQYLRNIIHHIGIGILSFDRKGEVQLVNATAKRLLKVGRIRNIDVLEGFSAELLEILTRLRTGQNALIRVRNGDEVVQLAIYAIELHLKGEEFKLVTIQNINSELEEKEMEAWQNLIRVLTHEIMNSITPISSLSGMLESEVEYLQDRQGETIQEGDFDDLYTAIHTIKRRSDGLIRFVGDFRSLTSMPEPRLQLLKVADLFEHVKNLLSHTFEAHGIVFSTHLSPENLTINADQELIEQVLINLIKNATEALQEYDEEGKEYKSISLIGRQDASNRAIITVKDNGPGIDKDAIDRIFIPFFSTKKNGSGIGLSLSRQIMRSHQGALAVSSKPGVGSSFDLKF